MKNKKIFFKRLGAYVIDTFIISLLINFLVKIPFLSYNEEKYASINEKLEIIMNEFANDDITLNDFKNEYIIINYNLLKLENKINICKLILVLLYFVVLQWKLDGQTIGKKLFKIKVISTSNGDLSISNYLFRAILINNLFLYMMLVIGRYYLNDISNYYLAFSITLIKNIIMYGSVLMILLRKDARGMHDLLVKTKVIEIEK